MMIKKIGMMREVGLASAVSALVFGAASLQAEEFSASATIQNTVAVEKVQDMDFGVLYASGANNKAVAGLKLAPEGGITSVTPILVDAAGATTDAPKFLSLGDGQAARGRINSGLNVTITVPGGKSSLLATGSAWAPGEGEPLSVNGDSTEPKFYLVDFVVGDVDGGTADVGTNPGDFDITADFGAESIEFGIGATIFTDGGAGNGTIKEKYQAALYTGTFEVEASY